MLFRLIQFPQSNFLANTLDLSVPKLRLSFNTMTCFRSTLYRIVYMLHMIYHRNPSRKVSPLSQFKLIFIFFNTLSVISQSQTGNFSRWVSMVYRTHQFWRCLIPDFYHGQFWNWRIFQWIIKVLSGFKSFDFRRFLKFDSSSSFFHQTNFTIWHISVWPHHISIHIISDSKKLKSFLKDYEIISMFNFDWWSRSSWLPWLYDSKWTTVSNVERIIWWASISKKWREKRIC